MREFVIGDIHGGYKALLQCLDRSGFNKQTDRLIVLGDVVDGWPQVKQCVEELLTVKNRIVLLGNHDEWFLQWLKGAPHPAVWQQGGLGTLGSYLGSYDNDDFLIRDDVPALHRLFFSNMKLYYVDQKRNRCFVHAGFDRKVQIREQVAYNKEIFYWDRELWQKALCCHGTKLKTADDFEEIFIGHSATTNWSVRESQTKAGIIIPEGQRITTPIESGGVWNIDTGGGMLGKLTIMDVDTKQYWQSDLVADLYPGYIAR